jgi:sarcosine oxidase subunit alpha
MLSGSVRTYLNRYAVAPGRRVVIATTGDDGWDLLADCVRLGVDVAAIVDRRGTIAADRLDLARRAGAQVFAGGHIGATAGARRLSAVEVLDSGGKRQRLTADLLAMAGGWTPAIGLACHLGAKPVWNEESSAFLAAEAPPGLRLVGGAAGLIGLVQALESGAHGGAEAASACGFAVAVPAMATHSEAAAPLWFMPANRQKAFVDFQHDVAVSDVALAHREGYRSVEHLKRYTTLGMATDQGRTANVNGLALMAQMTGRDIAATGTTRLRPPHTPVAIGALAGMHRGRDYRPTRLTPAHGWAREQGAVFIETGPWLRAQYFPRTGEDDWLQSVTREVHAVRSAVGLCDVSTLGKIELVGSDAATFLDRVYVNTIATLPVGRARYGLMLREDGFTLDDGTIARLQPDRFVITTTTGEAHAVMSHLEYCHQVLWPELDVHFVSISDRWAQFAVAGPRSRAVLQAVLDPGLDISGDAFPFMAAAEGRAFGGLRIRLFRISFSGELAYELAVPAPQAETAVRALMQAGAGEGITPYGLEAMSVMRIEKGYAAGGEINGQTTPRDLGLEKMLAKRKDYIGRVLMRRRALQEASRPTLVGLRPTDRSARLHGGAHFLALQAPATAAHDEGWVSSVAFSPTLGHWIGLGFLANGAARHGERVRAYDPLRNRETEVEIRPPCQFDPEGVRLHG